MPNTAIDFSARVSVVRLGGIDVSAQFVRFTGSDSHLTPRGFVDFTGQITLGEIRNGVELDDWAVEPFPEDGLVEIEVLRQDGTQALHPRSGLRIIGSDYDPDTNSMVVNVGCLLAARNSAKQADQIDSGVTPGLGDTVRNVVFRLLGQAGIAPGQIVWNSVISYSFRDRPQISGSPIATAGKMLASAGAFMWCNNAGQVVVDDVALRPNSLLVSSPAYALGEFRQVKVGDRPLSEVLVSGSARRVIPRDPSFTRTQNIRGLINREILNSDGSLNDFVSVRRTVRRIVDQEDTDFNSSTETKTRSIDISGQQVYRGWPGYPDAALVSNAETSESQTRYEQGQKARLLEVVETKEQIRALALAAFLDALQAGNEDARSLFNLLLKSGNIPVEESVYRVEYDDRDRIIRSVREVKRPLVTVLGQLGDPKWFNAFQLLGIPDRLVVVEEEEITWEELVPDEWRRRTSKSFAQAMSPEYRPALIGRLQVADNDVKLLRIYLDAVRVVREPDIVETSSTGRTNPGQAQRLAARYRTEKLPIEQSVEFPSSTAGWAPTCETMTIPYLPDSGKTGALPEGFVYNYGRVWGGVKRSTWRTLRSEIALADWLIDGYRPWGAIEVSRLGRVYQLALNGVSWLSDGEQTLVSGDFALLGESTGAIVDPDGNVTASGTITPPYRVNGGGNEVGLSFDVNLTRIGQDGVGLGNEVGPTFGISV